MNHEHKYFLFQVKQVFEPAQSLDNVITYRAIEYGYFGCNCGSAVKSEVKNSVKPVPSGYARGNDTLTI